VRAAPAGRCGKDCAIVASPPARPVSKGPGWSPDRPSGTATDRGATGPGSAAVFLDAVVTVQGQKIAGASAEQPLPISRLAELTKLAMANYF